MCRKCVENMIKNRYRIVLAKKIKGYRWKELVRLTGKHRITLWRWSQKLQRQGLTGLANSSTKPVHHPKEYSSYLKFLISDLRNHYLEGPDKIKLKLRKYYDIDISVSGIAKELTRSGLVMSRKKRRKNFCHHWRKKQYLPGDKIQMDPKFVFKSRASQLFQFSAIDLDTCVVFANIYDNTGNSEAIRFLIQTKQFYPFGLRVIQTDNAGYFTNYYTGYTKSTDPTHPRLHPFDLTCAKLNLEHYLIDKGKPQQNGKVERFHRTVDDEFYDRYRFRNKTHLLSKFREYLDYYNNEREHLGLGGLTPLEKLQTYPQYQHIYHIS